MNPSTNVPSQEESESGVVGRLAAQHGRFLGFLRARIGDPALAEDILQSAYVKAMEHGGEIKNQESIVAWFYRILRNAITDQHRREAARTRAHEAHAAEAPVSYHPELKKAICACIGDVIRDLRTEYREAIEQIDLGDMTVQSFAEAHGTSPNNASVRLHRARKEIAKKLTAVCGTCAEHKCMDCSCRRSHL